MTILYKEQLGDLMKELKLPLIVAQVGVGNGMFSKTIMDWGTKRLYMIDEWKGAT